MFLRSFRNPQSKINKQALSNSNLWRQRGQEDKQVIVVALYHFPNNLILIRASQQLSEIIGLRQANFSVKAKFKQNAMCTPHSLSNNCKEKKIQIIQVKSVSISLENVRKRHRLFNSQISMDKS